MRSRALLALLVMPLAGCFSDPATPTPLSEPVLAQPVYTVSTVVTDTSITLNVIARNSESHTIRFELFDTCTVVLRLTDPQRGPAPPLNRSTLPPTCTGAPKRFVLDTGAETSWPTHIRFGVPGQPLTGRVLVEAFINQSQPTDRVIRVFAQEMPLR